MTFDAQAIFANLAEKERIKGHHSPEGRAIRTLGRALSGWSTGVLAPPDVVVLCDQAVEDWLKGRLKRRRGRQPRAELSRGGGLRSRICLSPERSASAYEPRRIATRSRSRRADQQWRAKTGAASTRSQIVEPHWL